MDFESDQKQMRREAFAQEAVNVAETGGGGPACGRHNATTSKPASPELAKRIALGLDTERCRLREGLDARERLGQFEELRAILGRNDDLRRALDLCLTLGLLR